MIALSHAIILCLRRGFVQHSGPTVHLMARRKTAAPLLVMVCMAVAGQGTSHGQSPVEEGKIYRADLKWGIHRSSLDGSNVEQLVKPDLRRPDKIVPGCIRGEDVLDGKGVGKSPSV